MFCENCGTKNQEDSKFCYNCGHLLYPTYQISTPKRQGMSTGAIVGIVIGGVFVVILGFIFIFFSALLVTYVDNNLEATESHNTGYVDLNLDDTQLSFKLPSGYFESGDNTDDYKEYDNIFGDYLIYYIDYAYDDYYNNEKKRIKNIYDTQYADDTKLTEYTTKINGKNFKVFYIDYKELGLSYRVTYAFYEINEDYYATVVLGIEDLEKKDLNKYIIFEDMYI